MKLYFFLGLQICIFASNNAIDQSDFLNPSLKIDRLIYEVIERNPDLVAAQKRVNAAAVAVIPPQILDDPQFMIRSMGNPIGSPSRFKSELWYELTQKLPFPGKLRLRGRIAEQQREFVRSEEIKTLLDLIVQAKKLYYRLYLNNVEIHINNQNHDIIFLLIKSALALYKTGRVKQADVLKGEIELQMLDNELLMLESEKITIISLLNALLDRPQSAPIGNPIEAFHEKINFNYNHLEALAIQERPELYGIKATVEEQKFKARLARRDYYPDFDVGFMYQHTPGEKDRAWSVMFKFNIPIWIEQKQKNVMWEAEFSALAQSFALRGLENTIKGRIKEILAKISAADEQIFLYESGLLSKIAESFTSYLSSYRVGREDILIVLDTRRQLQDFEFDYEQIRIQREILLAELEREIGIPFEEILLYIRKSNMPSFLDPEWYHIYWQFKPWSRDYKVK